MKSSLLVLTLLLLLPAASRAAMMSGQDLLLDCSGEGIARATCDGYLMAVTDFVLRREVRGRGNEETCVPDNVTVDQVREAVVDLGRRGRATRAPAGIGLVAAAMRMAWPCNGAPDAAPNPDAARGGAFTPSVPPSRAPNGGAPRQP